MQSGKHTYTDPTDGTVYEWNEEKRAWFPMVDDNFIAMYQANYGFTEVCIPRQLLLSKESRMNYQAADADHLLRFIWID